MAKTRKQRESDLKLARQGFMIVAVFVGVLVWGESHSLMAGILCFGLVLIAIEALLIVPRLLQKRRFTRSDIADVDSMSWSRFEEFIASHFHSRGYRTRLTPTYDQGGDVIADANGERVVVQVKKSNGTTIGNKAVQQAVAATGYYQATRAVVVTNQHFTQAAIDLAKANDVELWDRDRLAQEMLKAQPSRSPRGVGPMLKHGSLPVSSSPPTCPRCGAAMTLRHSKYGPFWGCSTFPKCWGKRRA